MSLWKKEKEKKPQQLRSVADRVPCATPGSAHLLRLLPCAVATLTSCQQNRRSLLSPQGSCSCCCSFPIIFMWSAGFHQLVLSLEIASQRGFLATIAEAASPPVSSSSISFHSVSFHFIQSTQFHFLRSTSRDLKWLTFWTLTNV